jgi:diaminohydroxyphosphoribosylaminopyrimidine deaminase/5-amino-6-(5-phosphoribosylamino)uracil reductase
LIILNVLKHSSAENRHYVKIDTGKDVVNNILNALYDNGIVSVFVEGGAFTLDLFLSSGLWDECRVFKSPVILNEGVRAPVIPFSDNGNPGLTEINGDQLVVCYHHQLNK